MPGRVLASMGAAFVLACAMPLAAFAQSAPDAPAEAPPQKKTKQFKGKNYILFPDLAEALTLEQVIANANNPADPAQQKLALRSLGIRGMNDPTLSDLIVGILASETGVKSTDSNSNYQAAYWLGRIGENQEATATRVMSILEDVIATENDPNTKWAALGSMAITAESYASAFDSAYRMFMDKSVSDPDAKIRKAAMDGLNTIGNEYPGMRTKITDHLRGISRNDPDETLRHHAEGLIELLSSLGPSKIRTASLPAP